MYIADEAHWSGGHAGRQDVHDHNKYTLGQIRVHNVTIACLPSGDDRHDICRDRSEPYTMDLSLCQIWSDEESLS